MGTSYNYQGQEVEIYNIYICIYSEISAEMERMKKREKVYTFINLYEDQSRDIIKEL